MNGRVRDARDLAVIVDPVGVASAGVLSSAVQVTHVGEGVERRPPRATRWRYCDPQPDDKDNAMERGGNKGLRVSGTHLACEAKRPNRETMPPANRGSTILQKRV